MCRYSSKLVSSASSVENRWVGAKGFCSKESNSCCVLSICLMNILHCFSRFPKDTWELWWSKSNLWGRLSILVGIILTPDSPHVAVVLMSVIMHNMLERRWVQVIYRWLCTWVRCSSSIIEHDSWQICRVVDVSPSSAKLCVDVPEFHWWFEYYILDVAWPCFSSSLIFNV